ncbi:hypothetical protein D3C87_1403620 [compost metagenome]
MAKLKHGIFGPISGKLGSLVGASWMGIPYLRQAPKAKTRPAPRSAAQIANEQKMKFVNELLVPFHAFIAAGFQNQAIGKTALSAAYSINFHQAITGVYPNLGADYSKMTISKGLLPGLGNPEIVFTAPDTVQLIWQPNTSIKTMFDDQLILVLYSPELRLADGFTGGIKRSDRHCEFKIDTRLVGKALEVYLGLASINRKKAANSSYMGRLTP